MRFNYVNNLSLRYAVKTQVIRHNFNDDEYVKRLTAKHAENELRE